MSHYDTMGPFRPPGASRWRQAWAWGIVGFVAIAVAVAMVWASDVQKHGSHYDQTSLCDTRGATSITVLLVDATDTISSLQRQAIENRLTPLLAQLRSNERLDVYEVRPDRDLLSPVFSKCRPLSPDEVSEATGNKRLAQRRFDQEFGQKLSATLDGLLARQPSDRSPIMEAIQAADVRSLQSQGLRANPTGFRRRLILVSDMLENGEAGSHYRSVPDFEAYRNTPEFVHFSSDLSGVEVVILYLRRVTSRRIQGAAHVDFWDRWFAAQGATVERAIPIEG